MYGKAELAIAGAMHVSMHWPNFVRAVAHPIIAVLSSYSITACGLSGRSQTMLYLLNEAVLVDPTERILYSSSATLHIFVSAP